MPENVQRPKPFETQSHAFIDWDIYKGDAG